MAQKKGEKDELIDTRAKLKESEEIIQNLMNEMDNIRSIEKEGGVRYSQEKAPEYNVDLTDEQDQYVAGGSQDGRNGEAEDMEAVCS